jgi:hypothetical protein
MSPESKFWGLDGTAWTALATIVAMTLGFIGVFGKGISTWCRKPRLLLRFDRLLAHSECVQERFWQLRLPVFNRKWLNAATKVEVFLEYIEKQNVTHPFTPPTYLPIRLHWSHAGGPVCDRITGGTYRLIDFGKLSFSINAETGFGEAVMAELNEASRVVLGFDTEIPAVNAELRLPAGHYVLGLIVAATCVTKRYRVRVMIHNELFKPNKPLSAYFEAALV